MSDPTPIDFTPLDLRRDPAEWERLVARVLRDSEAEPEQATAPAPAVIRLESVRVLPAGNRE